MSDTTEGKTEDQANSTERDAEKVKEIAERAGGGSNKESDLGSNEDIDQIGGQAHDRSS